MKQNLVTKRLNQPPRTNSNKYGKYHISNCHQPILLWGCVCSWCGTFLLIYLNTSTLYKYSETGILFKWSYINRYLSNGRTNSAPRVDIGDIRFQAFLARLTNLGSLWSKTCGLCTLSGELVSRTQAKLGDGIDVALTIRETRDTHPITPIQMRITDDANWSWEGAAQDAALVAWNQGGWPFRK